MSNVISLDSRRKKVYEMMKCEWCHTEHPLVHTNIGLRTGWHGPCPGCDEDASIPLNKWNEKMIRL